MIHSQVDPFSWCRPGDGDWFSYLAVGTLSRFYCRVTVADLGFLCHQRRHLPSGKLTITNITMEHHHAINGKINYKYTINGSSSIAAMLVYQRVFESSSSLMIFSWIPQDFFRGCFVSSENPHFRPAQRWGHSATRSSQRWGKGSRNRAQCRCCCCRKLLAMGQ